MAEPVKEELLTLDLETLGICVEVRVWVKRGLHKVKADESIGVSTILRAAADYIARIDEIGEEGE